MDMQDEGIHELCEELWNRNIDGGWEHFVESNGVTIYRLYDPESGLYQYKTYGTLAGISPEVCADVYMDLDYRKKWDGYVKDLYAFKDGDMDGIYWQVKFPFMMSNRDYVYRRRLRKLEYKGAQVYCVIAESNTFSNEGERKGVIRVTEYVQKLVLMSDGKGGCSAFIHYFDNPKGMIPKMVINWAAQKGVPGFLTDMQKACRGYADYKAKLEK